MDSDLLEGLNEAQRQAVTHEDGPLLIVAGAGTGKTTVIVKRLAWLIATKRAATDQILALTFTDKAAGEIEERVDKLLPYGYTDLWISTFHSFAEKILKTHALDVGVSYDFRLLDATEQWLLVRQHLDRFQLSYYRPLGNPTKFIHALVRHFSRLKDEGILPPEYLAYAESRRLDLDREKAGKAKLKKNKDQDEVGETDRLHEVANAYHIYQQLLLENNALDFGDLIVYTLRLFKTRPDVLAQYREQFKYVLVDEFQDTNSAQYELVELIVEPRQNIAVVGDDDQSIYRFRGAAMSNILQFQTDFPSSRQIVLSDNYRSAQNILDLAYQFIQHNNPDRLEARLGGLSKRLRSTTAPTGEIAHLSGRTGEDEEQLIIEKIKQLKISDPESIWSDFAILARSNDEANRLDLALARAGIPHQSFTARGLYSKSVIIDALSYLKLLDNYHESTALWRVLSLPIWKIPNRDIIELNHQARRRSQSLFWAAEQAATFGTISQPSIRALNLFLRQLSELAAEVRERRPTELMVKSLTAIGYVAWIESQGEAKARLEFSYLNKFFGHD